MQTKGRIISFLLFILFTVCCGANEGILRSGKETPIEVNAVEEKPSFEKDLEAMSTAGFTFIYALRRRDGKAIDAEDVRIIKQLTVDTNRRVKTEEDHAVLIGSNFELPKDNLAAMYARFSVEDHSLPPVADANVNTNTKK